MKVVVVVSSYDLMIFSLVHSLGGGFFFILKKILTSLVLILFIVHPSNLTSYFFFFSPPNFQNLEVYLAKPMITFFVVPDDDVIGSIDSLN